MGLACFKAYDVRGRLPDELNDGIAYAIGRAFARYTGAKRVVVGGDVRLSSPSLKAALAEGLRDEGCAVIDLGMTGTEEIYFAAFHLDVDGGIEVTASHNPIDYNGLKFVERGAAPLSSEALAAIEARVSANDFGPVKPRGPLTHDDIRAAYVSHVLGFVDLPRLRPLKVVVNAGNGTAGPVLDAIETRLHSLGVPFSFIKIHHDPDGTFPHGIPNPLLPEKRQATAAAVVAHGADLGVAWDGDFDRCFLFDHTGGFIEGYYIVGLLAEAFLRRPPTEKSGETPGEKIIHDPRLWWNTADQVARAGGVAVASKTGHVFIKQRMRAENAIYGGEMSAHHYFRDFAYCDSGMIPWLVIAGLLSETGQPLADLVAARIEAYPCSGEINYKLADPVAAVARVRGFYAGLTPVVDETDGLSMAFATWRFNLRSSNTEPLLRLNVESRGDAGLVAAKVAEMASLINETSV